jgi:hypothetical protein
VLCYSAQYPGIYSEWIEWSICITFPVGNCLLSEIGVIWISPLFQMVGATRGTSEGFRAGQPGGSQQPPPPPPNLAEVMARQTELLNQLVQAQMGHFRQQPRGREEPLSASYQDFLSTQPPLFHKADEPLDADAWLRTIESKFTLLSAPCSEENKVLFAAQQLRSTARLVGSVSCYATCRSCHHLGRVSDSILSTSHTGRTH